MSDFDDFDLKDAVNRAAKAMAEAFDAQIAELLASVPEPKFLILHPAQPAPPGNTLRIVRSPLIPKGVGYEVDLLVLDFDPGLGQ